VTPEQRDWLQLARTENVGPITFFQLLRRYGTAAEALKAVPDLAAKGGLKRKLTIPSRSKIEDEFERLNRYGATLLCANEAAYPDPLKAIADPPPVITVMGRIDLLRTPCIAMVGARNATINGLRYAEQLARELGQRGQTIVSGLAAGIDAAAHRGGLATGTLAVVAGGIDVIYPPENEKLYRAIAEQGAIVAEMPFGFPISAQLFPRRNRIASGLSAGVIVVEAAMKSGSLITARMAMEQGREVMAVPGSPLDARAAGTNHLIKGGATLVTDVNDVLAAISHSLLSEPRTPTYAHQAPESIDESAVEAARKQLLACLSFNPQPVDVVIRVCQSPAPVVSAALLELELAGHVVRLPGHQIALLAEPMAKAE